MGPLDENLILGSDPAVLSSSSYPAFGNIIKHISHQITTQRSNAMVISCTLYSVNLKECASKHHLITLENLFITMPRLVLFFVNG